MLDFREIGINKKYRIKIGLIEAKMEIQDLIKELWQHFLSI